MLAQNDDFSVKLLSQNSLLEANEIIFSSKSYWRYSENYLLEALKLLKLTKEDFQKQSFYGLKKNEDLIGLFSFCENEAEVLLDHFWLLPQIIGKGYGKIMWSKALKYAKEKEINKFKIYSDPPASGFYIQMGAKCVGKKPSRILSGPIFPVLEYKVL